jgi:hypothetical protein
MTYSSSSTAAQERAQNPDTAPKYFKEAPVNYEIHNNEYSSGPYYYDQARNSWIFYIPGTFIPGPPVDPDNGNIWVDASSMYLMYVYNAGEMTFPGAVPDSWYALTTNKKAYDYLVLPIGDDGVDINIIDPPSNRVDIFQQSAVYFNRLDADIKVRLSESDGQGGTLYKWSSITQRSLEDAVEDPNMDFNTAVPAPALRQLMETTNALQARVDALNAQVNP